YDPRPVCRAVILLVVLRVVRCAGRQTRMVDSESARKVGTQSSRTAPEARMARRPTRRLFTFERTALMWGGGGGPDGAGKGREHRRRRRRRDDGEAESGIGDEDAEVPVGVDPGGGTRAARRRRKASGGEHEVPRSRRRVSEHSRFLEFS